MDELIDILDSEGNFTGKIELKSHAHRLGLFHATVHIWFYTSDEMILLQQRGKYKKTHPLLWDVSVAGHVATGESIEISAIREIEEEIGLNISLKDLIKIGVFKSVQKHHDNLIDCEFHHTFLSELKVPLENLKKQESEVEALKLIPISDFQKKLINNETREKFVSHYEEYYKTVINTIKKRL